MVKLRYRKSDLKDKKSGFVLLFLGSMKVDRFCFTIHVLRNIGAAVLNNCKEFL